MENFTVGEIMPIELIRAFGIQKQAAAITNTNLELLNQIKGHAITEAAEEVAQGRHDNQFNLRIYQVQYNIFSNLHTVHMFIQIYHVGSVYFYIDRLRYTDTHECK